MEQNQQSNNSPENISNFSIGSKVVESAVDFSVKVAQILIQDKRFSLDAYDFVMSALRYTLTRLDEHRHVSGRELLMGIREYAMRQYGPMTRTVLENWGLKSTLDFGEIVFNLVETGIIQRKQEDTKEEFRDVFDFKTAFDKPYRKTLKPKFRVKIGKRCN